MWQPEKGEDQPDRTDDVGEASDAGQTAPDDAEATGRREYRGTGIMWGAIALVLIAAAFVIVALQNSHTVEFEFLWLDVSTPLILIIAITIAATLVVDEVVGLLWRRRRRTRLREREELRELRSRR